MEDVDATRPSVPCPVQSWARSGGSRGKILQGFLFGGILALGIQSPKASFPQCRLKRMAVVVMVVVMILSAEELVRCFWEEGAVAAAGWGRVIDGLGRSSELRLTPVYLPTPVSSPFGPSIFSSWNPLGCVGKNFHGIWEFGKECCNCFTQFLDRMGEENRKWGSKQNDILGIFSCELCLLRLTWGDVIFLPFSFSMTSHSPQS